ncbi:MAG: hypothetical protein HYV63_20670 [Candidatus Schekmanbacteria bacterium]|nr:hypothetical protein [Candidatus Schekmanbacteria bacterium]
MTAPPSRGFVTLAVEAGVGGFLFVFGLAMTGLLYGCHRFLGGAETTANE